MYGIEYLPLPSPCALTRSPAEAELGVRLSWHSRRTDKIDSRPMSALALATGSPPPDVDLAHL